MGMTISEKILAAHAGKDKVHPGEVVNVAVDLILVNDLSASRAATVFKKIEGAHKVFDPSKVVVVSDHFTPAKDIQSAQLARAARDFAMMQGAVYFEVGRGGIEHVLLPEVGLVAPGKLILGGDSHTCTSGALGAFAAGFGSTDIAAAMLLGQTWLKVPPSIKLLYDGRPRKWVTGKDLILFAIGKLGVDGATYHALEFAGDLVSELTMADRFTMANMAVEAGAKNGIFAPDAKTIAYAREAGCRDYQLYESDPDASYSKVIEFDVSSIEVQVAAPFSPGNVRPVSQLGEVQIDQVVIGSCANGRLEDLRIAGQILTGREVHPEVRAIVIPGSQKVYLEALREGLIEVFIKSNCVVSTPTCGPCMGGYMGILAEGERCLATTNRNFVGRMGHSRSEVYLAGPAVAAASAVAGRIVDPEEI
jgi:3-isopropylmalate/(R)-2-methylmalate dehydratase large subunit